MQFNSRRTGIAVFVIAVAIGVTALVMRHSHEAGDYAGTAADLRNESPEVRAAVRAKIVDGLRSAAADIMKECPKKLDEATTLLRVEARDNAVMAYFYEFVLPENFDADSFVKQIPDVLAAQVCTNATMRQVMEMGGGYSYTYSAPNGKELFAISFDEERCASHEKNHPQAGVR